MYHCFDYSFINTQDLLDLTNSQSQHWLDRTKSERANDNSIPPKVHVKKSDLFLAKGAYVEYKCSEAGGVDSAGPGVKLLKGISISQKS
ncbi:hypothetical protein BJV82DRAFT_665845 [Fennellomyces sp. T-0311]|nr:hypothetical protein BJV82DRAFT_665845 [Fennellomyces sp. T-0311]